MTTRKVEFLRSLAFAADKLREEVGPKPRDFHIYDGDILSAARMYGIDEATGTPSRCPVSRAIVAAAYERNDPLRVVAAAEEAWEYVEAEVRKKTKKTAA